MGIGEHDGLAAAGRQDAQEPELAAIQELDCCFGNRVCLVGGARYSRVPNGNMG
jgi:hypothetical protein